MIQANELSLIDFLNYYKQDGESFLKEQRMMITSVDAWGVLRKDLIETLGVERAKRFLLRYGRHCGRVEAKMLKNMFDWKDDLEWLLAGTHMHKITGRTFSNLIKFDADIQEGKFDVEGFWVDSYEAKQHLEHFSYYHDPICFFLIGWSGGYTSECLGKPVYFKETQCMGKGDQHCYYVGKTLEEWGDELQDELVDYEENLSDELDRVYRRVEKQKEALKLGSTISQKLTKALLQGKRLNAFADIIFREMRCAVLIENQHFQVIANSSQVVEEEQNWSLKELVADPSCQMEKAKLIKEQRAIKCEVEAPTGENIYMLVAPIVIRKQVYGYISIGSSKHRFGELEEDILERIATVCAVQMLNEQTIIETEQRLKGELLEELFNENGDASIVAAKLASLGYNLKAPHYVLVFQIETQANEGNELIVPDDDRYLSIRNKILAKLRKEIEQEGQRVIISTKLNHIHTMISADYLNKRNIDIRKFLSNFIDYVEEDKKNQCKLFIGVSSLCQDYNKLYRMFKEAVKAIEIGKMKNQNSSFTLASDLGHLKLLLDARNPNELLDYANEKLDILLKYDQTNNSEFMKTLNYYIECECNLYKTAREMNVSISGMRYRIKRVEELIDVDLSQSSNRFEIQLALQIYIAFGMLSY